MTCSRALERELSYSEECCRYCATDCQGCTGIVENALHVWEQAGLQGKVLAVEEISGVCMHDSQVMTVLLSTPVPLHPFAQTCLGVDPSANFYTLCQAGAD